MKRIALVLLSVALVVGCSGDGNDECNALTGDSIHDLTVSFEGFDEHVGQKFEVRSVLPSGPIGVAQVPAIPAAEFSVTLNLVCFKTHDLEFYADVNGNGVYDPPPTDHAWRTAVSGGTFVCS